MKPCADYGGKFPHVIGFVERPEGPHSAYFASCHDHDQRVAWINVVLGTWSVEPPPEAHVTFSCGLRADGAMAVDAPVDVGSPASQRVADGS